MGVSHPLPQFNFINSYLFPLMLFPFIIKFISRSISSFSAQTNSKSPISLFEKILEIATSLDSLDHFNQPLMEKAGVPFIRHGNMDVLQSVYNLAENAKK